MTLNFAFTGVIWVLIVDFALKPGFYLSSPFLLLGLLFDIFVGFYAAVLLHRQWVRLKEDNLSTADNLLSEYVVAVLLFPALGIYSTWHTAKGIFNHIQNKDEKTGDME